MSAHHLHLIDVDVGDYDSRCHVRPPLRSPRDRDGLREGLKDSVISAICSDHQPHDRDAKDAPFEATEPGISALQSLLPLTLALVEDKVLSLSRALAAITCQPARILGIDAGTLRVGAGADICIFDPEAHWTLTEENIASAGKNTPFKGWDFKGKVMHTLFGGKLVYTEASR